MKVRNKKKIGEREQKKIEKKLKKTVVHDITGSGAQIFSPSYFYDDKNH